MNILKRNNVDKTELVQIGNHLFFITAMLFVAHQNMLHPAPLRSEVPMIAQALNLQPRTPPPTIDPDQVSGEEVDLSIRPEFFVRPTLE